MTYRYKHQKGGKFMALRSQLITKEFPELDRVERLNNEAFPEEERIPLSDFLKLDGRDWLSFLCLLWRGWFCWICLSFSINAKVFYVSFFVIVPQMRSHGYGSEIIDKLVDFYGPSRSMVLEVERLDEPNDNPEQRVARWDFYKRNGFKTSNAFLEYEGLSFEILYRGDHFDEKATETYSTNFRKMLILILVSNIVTWAIYKESS